MATKPTKKSASQVQKDLDKMTASLESALESIEDVVEETEKKAEKISKKAKKTKDKAKKVEAKVETISKQSEKSTEDVIKSFDSISNRLEEMAEAADDTAEDIGESIKSVAEKSKKIEQRITTTSKEAKTSTASLSNVSDKIRAINTQILKNMPEVEAEIERLAISIRGMKDQFKKTSGEYSTTGKVIINHLNSVLSSVTQNTDAENIIKNLDKIKEQIKIVKKFEASSKQKEHLLEQLSAAESSLTIAATKRIGVLSGGIGSVKTASIMATVSGGNRLATGLGLAVDKYIQSKRTIDQARNSYSVDLLKDYRESIEGDHHQPRTLKSSDHGFDGGIIKELSMIRAVLQSMSHDMKDSSKASSIRERKTLDSLNDIDKNTTPDREKEFESGLRSSMMTGGLGSQGIQSSAGSSGGPLGLLKGVLGAGGAAGFGILDALGIGAILGKGSSLMTGVRGVAGGLISFMAKSLVVVEGISLAIKEANSWISSDDSWKEKLKRTVGKTLIPALGFMVAGPVGAMAGFIVNKLGGEELTHDLINVIKYTWSEDVVPAFHILANKVSDWISNIGDFFRDTYASVSSTFNKYLVGLYQTAASAVSIVPGASNVSDTLDKMATDLINAGLADEKKYIREKAAREKDQRRKREARDAELHRNRARTVEENNKEIIQDEINKREAISAGGGVVSDFSDWASGLASEPSNKKGATASDTPTSSPIWTSRYTTGSIFRPKEEKNKPIVESPASLGGLSPVKAAKITDQAQKDNMATAMKFFMEKGYTKEQAAGIVGSLAQESSLNPNAVNPSSRAFGIGQWLGDRKRDFMKYAASQGKNPNDLQTQLEWHHIEATGSESKADTKIRQAKTVEEAAYAHRKYFERPGEAEANDARRMKMGRAAYESYGSTTNIAPTLSAKITNDFDRPAVAVAEETQNKQKIDLSYDSSKSTGNTVVNNIGAGNAGTGGSQQVNRQAPRGSEPSLLGHQNSDYSGSYA